MSSKTAVYPADLEKVIRDLEPADPAWQAAAGEYVRLKRAEESKQLQTTNDKEQNEMPVIPQTRFDVLPMGEYNARITNANLTEGRYGPQVEFLFTIDGGPHDGANLKTWTSAKFSPRSKLYEYTRAAFKGKPIPEDYDLDTDHLVGRKVNVMITIKVKPEDASEFNKIDSVRAWRDLSTVVEQPPAPTANGEQAGDIPF